VVNIGTVCGVYLERISAELNRDSPAGLDS
jgi:hypothetical protein